MSGPLREEELDIFELRTPNDDGMVTIRRMALGGLLIMLVAFAATMLLLVAGLVIVSFR